MVDDSERVLDGIIVFKSVRLGHPSTGIGGQDESNIGRVDGYIFAALRRCYTGPDIATNGIRFLNVLNDILLVDNIVDEIVE